MVTSENKIFYLDLLRALAMIAVVVIHIASPLENMTFGNNEYYWMIGNIYNSMVRFAVPLFLMLSGATLLQKEYPLSVYLRKRFSRVVWPFLFWLILYWVYRWSCLLPAKRPHSFSAIANWAQNLFLNEGVSKHFWYIYMILFLYLLIPFAGKWLRKLNISSLISLVVVWLILLVFFRSEPFNAYSWRTDYLSKFGGYILHSGYILTGYTITRIHVNWNKLKITAGIVYACSVFIAVYSTYLLSKSSGHLNLSNYSYLSVNTFIQTLAVFILCIDVNLQNTFAIKIINGISNHSYGIYLVHIMVIGILYQNNIFWKIANPVISVPLLTVIVVSISFGIIFSLRKIPVFRNLAG